MRLFNHTEPDKKSNTPYFGRKKDELDVTATDE